MSVCGQILWHRRKRPTSSPLRQPGPRAGRLSPGDESTDWFGRDSISETAFFFGEKGDKRSPLAVQAEVSVTQPWLARRARQR